MSKRIVSCVGGLILIAVTVLADPGDIIVRDEFTGAGVAPTVGNTPTDLNGRTPDTANLPGGNWVAGTGYSNGIYNNYAWVNADISVRKSIATAGSYTKPAQITISADVNLGWTDAATRGTGIGGSSFGSARGIGVGYFVPTGQFTGVVVAADGSLNIVDSSFWYSPTFIANLSWGGSGSFDPSAWYNLTYTIDTSSGSIMSLDFDGVPYSVTTTAFGTTDTNLAGFYVNSFAASTYGYIDNFQVMERIPEPSTLACLALAGLLALRRRR